jgi:hypothetical protein
MPSSATSNRFWPDDIRLVISISTQFEAGGQTAKGTDSTFRRSSSTRSRWTSTSFMKKPASAAG